ncbi:hypothetical protein E1294_40250, partial [Nonomuraea diastatica]
MEVHVHRRRAGARRHHPRETGRRQPPQPAIPYEPCPGITHRRPAQRPDQAPLPQPRPVRAVGVEDMSTVMSQIGPAGR